MLSVLASIMPDSSQICPAHACCRQVPPNAAAAPGKNFFVARQSRFSDTDKALAAFAMF
jgi:hypothetical protein